MNRTHLIAAGLLGALTSITSVAFADEPSVQATVIVNVGGQGQTAAPAPAIAPAPTSDEWRTQVDVAAVALLTATSWTVDTAAQSSIDEAVQREGSDFRAKVLRFHRDLEAGASLAMLASAHAEIQEDGHHYVWSISTATQRQHISMGNRIEGLSEELDSFRLAMNNATGRFGGAPVYRPEPQRPMPPVIVYYPAPQQPQARPLPPPPPYARFVMQPRQPRFMARGPRHRAYFRPGVRRAVTWNF